MDIIKQVDLKEKIKNEYLNGNKKSDQKDKQLSCIPCKILQTFLKEFQQLDDRIRKLVTIYKALNPRDDIDRI